MTKAQSNSAVSGEVAKYAIPLSAEPDKVETQKRALIRELRDYCKHYGVKPSTNHLKQIATYTANENDVNPYSEYYNARSDAMHKRIVAIAREEMIAAGELKKK